MYETMHKLQRIFSFCKNILKPLKNMFSESTVSNADIYCKSAHEQDLDLDMSKV
jgi:hypothetical protein